jgi:hypothetical protein
MPGERFYYKQNSGYALFRDLGKNSKPYTPSLVRPLIPETKVPVVEPIVTPVVEPIVTPIVTPIVLAADRVEWISFNKLLDAHIMITESFLTLIGGKKEDVEPAMPVPHPLTFGRSSPNVVSQKYGGSTGCSSDSDWLDKLDNPIPSWFTPYTTPEDRVPQNDFKRFKTGNRTNMSLVGYFRHWKNQRRAQHFQKWKNSTVNKTSLVVYFRHWKNQRRAQHFQKWKNSTVNKTSLVVYFRHWRKWNCEHWRPKRRGHWLDISKTGREIVPISDASDCTFLSLLGYYRHWRKYDQLVNDWWINDWWVIWLSRMSLTKRFFDSWKAQCRVQREISKKVERCTMSWIFNKLRRSFVHLRELTANRLHDTRQTSFLSRRWYFPTLYRNFYFWRKMYRMDRMRKVNEMGRVWRAFQYWKVYDTVFVNIEGSDIES